MADPGFSRWGDKPLRLRQTPINWGKHLLIGKIFAQKKLLWGGGASLLDPQWPHEECNYFPLSHCNDLEPVMYWKEKGTVHRPGIEPGPPAWQASILPLNQRCSHGDVKRYPRIQLLYLSVVSRTPESFTNIALLRIICSNVRTDRHRHTTGQEDATDILPFRKRGWQRFIICLSDHNFVCRFCFL